MVRKILLSIVSVMIFCVIGSAQNRQITGTVTDPSGSPVAGAMVALDGTSTAVITDNLGQFSISAPANGSLTVSLIGYDAANVALAGRNNISVILVERIESIDDVIVVAYGVAKRESFTGSVAVVGDKELSKRTVSDVSKALAGQVPGVSTLSGGGQPGQGASIRIRGTGSIYASNEPLIVVDGAPFNGTLASINPNDIASISVLKDASASALYGSRGANGVVLITTKRGNGSGRANVNFRAVVGLASRALKNYDLLNQTEFVEATYAALKNPLMYVSGMSDADAHTAAVNNLSSTLGGEHYNPFRNYKWNELIDPATGKVHADAQSAWNENWMDEITNKSAIRQDYSVGINGGDNRTTYALSAGYLKEEGWLKNTNFERFSGSANVDHRIRHWLRMGLNTAYTYSIQNGTQYADTQTGNVWYTAQFMAPIYPMYRKDADKNDLLDENGNRMYDYGNEDGGSRPKGARFNSLGDLLDNIERNNRDEVRYGGYLTLGSDDAAAGWLQGLKLSVNMNGNVDNRNLLRYYNMYHGDAAESNGEISRYHVRRSSYTFNQILTYNRTFGKHSVNALAGHEYYDYLYSQLWATRTNLFDGIYELAPGVTLQEGNSYSDRDRIEAYFGRLNYGFDNKYYIEGHYRRDGSSRFHSDYRWGDFWGAGASWRISQEEFMKGVTWVDNLTYKISYGSTGNNALSSGYYAWESFYDLGFPNANNSGAVIVSLANPAVSWETVGTFNTGIEASLFNSRLRVSAEYYIRKTSDMLLEYPMAMSTGFTGYNANVGDMTNRGFELTLGGTIINRPNFVWDATLIGYTNKNRVDRLTETDQIVSGVRVIEVGKPINTYYMSKTAGVDPANGKQLWWVYDEDKDGNPVNERISSDIAKASISRYYQGSPHPDFQGSFGSNFVIFKNFDLSFLTTFSLGGKVYESVYSQTMLPMYFGDALNRHVLRSWSKPGDITDVPRLQVNSGYPSHNRGLIDASYFAINNITVGYTLPSQLLKKINMSSMRIFLTMDNVTYFTHLQGMDPIYNFSGGSNYSYAPVRTMSVGLDINF